MADPAESAARNAGDPDDETHPNPDTIADALALVTEGTTWDAESVMAAKRVMLALCAEVRRLRSLAGVVE